MLPSFTPIATRIARRRLKKSLASAAERRSGSVTISMSGTPLRLKSRYVKRSESANPSCSDLPASSSRWTRVMPTLPLRAAALVIDPPGRRQRALVLRDLIALRQVRIEVVLAREDRQRLHRAAERVPGAHAELDRPAVQHRQRPGHAEADGTDVGVRRRAEARAAAAEDFRLRQELRVDFQTDDRLEGHGMLTADRPQDGTDSGSAKSTGHETSGTGIAIRAS